MNYKAFERIGIKRITGGKPMKTFMASKQEDIEGGILYTNGCPDLVNASMIIAAKLKKVVFNREPINSDEMCALELIKENGITVVCNPNIIL